MDITPMDMTHKDFNRSFRGYNMQEVREYLEEISASIEESLQERAQLLAEIDNLKKSLERYHNIEDTLQNTLLLAQRTSEEAIVNSNKQAKLIVDEAHRQGREIEEQFAKIKGRKDQFLLEFRTLLQTYLQHIQETAPKEEPPDAP